MVNDLKRFKGDVKFWDEWEHYALDESIKKENYLEGKEAGKIEVAKNMLAKSLDIKLISEITGLSIDEIESLKD